jgi:hypothetical protein
MARPYHSICIWIRAGDDNLTGCLKGASQARYRLNQKAILSFSPGRLADLGNFFSNSESIGNLEAYGNVIKSLLC